MEGPRGQAGHPAAHGRNTFQLRPAGGIGRDLGHMRSRLGVARGESHHGLAADRDGSPEVAALGGVLFVGRQHRDPFLGLALDAQQTALQDHVPGRGQVAARIEPVWLEVLGEVLGEARLLFR